MATRIVDLSVTIEDNMPPHKLFQRPVLTHHLTHETSKAFNLGVEGDAMTFQTNFIAMLDNVGTHVDAFRHVNPKGAPVDEMPMDLFMGPAVCFDLQHIPDLGDITAQDMEEAEKKAGVRVDGHIVLLCTGFHKRNYPSLDSVWKNPLLTVEAKVKQARRARRNRRCQSFPEQGGRCDWSDNPISSKVARPLELPDCFTGFVPGMPSNAPGE